jgi:hypothetical protein
MRRNRIPLALTLLLAAAALALPATGGATAPLKGARYAGVITVQHFPGRTIEFPLSFAVDPSGREVGPLVFPEGAPFGLDCQQGPLGEPASGRHAAIESGGIDVSLPLKFEFDPTATGQPDLGTVHLEGSFRPHGVFAGRLDNRTPIKACRGSWSFKLHARP